MDDADSTRPWRGMHHRVSGRKRDDYGQYYDLAVALTDGPRTVEEIKGHYESYLRLLGFFTPLKPFSFSDEEWDREIRDALAVMTEWGWAVEEDGTYSLTEKGREEAEKPLRDMRRARSTIGSVTKPETVSKVSTGAHLLLAAVKLPAAFLSGSVGLLNDGIDTLLDGLSSILVYLGFRYDRERAVNVVLTLLMLGVSLMTLNEAVKRLLTPYSPDVDWFTFAATILSAVVCGLLYFYQSFIGAQSGSIALITQSVDSRNHVVVAAGVTAGLIGSLYDAAILDTLVGLGVALIIFRSAVELLIEMVKSIGGDEQGLAKHRLPFSERYQAFRRSQLRDWLLYKVDNGEAATMEGLRKLGSKAYDFSNNPMLRELGVAAHPAGESDLEAVTRELLDDGYLEDDGEIRLTRKGSDTLRKSLSGKKHIFHM